MRDQRSRVLKRLSKKDSVSNSRKNYLQKLASLNVRANMRVDFSDSIDAPACCRYIPEKKAYHIDIMEQSVFDVMTAQNTTLPEKYGDISNGYLTAFVQEGLLYHELGHVLFSDYNALSEVENNVTLQRKNEFHSLVNAFEDAVIEIYLREMFNCDKVLSSKNEILWHCYGSADVVKAHLNDLLIARQVAQEIGKYDAGIIDWARGGRYDEVIELAEDALYDVIQEPVARKRYERLVQLWNDLDLDDKGDQTPDQLPDENVEWAKTDQMTDPDMVPEVTIGQPQSEEEEEEEDEEDASPDVQPDEVNEDDLEDLKDEKDSAEQDAQSSGNDLEIDQISGEMDLGTGAGGGSGEIVVGDPHQYSASNSMIDVAERRAKYLEKTIRDHFTPNAGADVEYNKRSGTFDSRRMIAAARGSTKCFKTYNDVDRIEPLLFVFLDHSGSMGGRKIAPAASAATSIVKAFSDVGADVYFYRFGSTIELIKTPSMDYEDVKEAICSTRTRGGTRMRNGLEKATEIAKQHPDESYLITITDGKPSSAEVDGCKTALSEFPGKTACVQLYDSGKGFEESYDGFTIIENINDVKTNAQSVLRRMVMN